MMKALTTFAIAVGLLSASPGAIQLHRRTDGPPRVVGFPIARRVARSSISRGQLRRRGTVQVTLEDNHVRRSLPPNHLPRH
jgi:hypothetical protein